jgi:uncharacterized protein YneF (UPF0154 family)
MIDGEALGGILAGEILPMIVGLWFGWRFFTSAKQKKALRKMFRISEKHKKTLCEMFGQDGEDQPKEKDDFNTD